MRWEAYVVNQNSELTLLSFDPGVGSNRTIDRRWVETLWKHMIDQTHAITDDQVRLCTLFEFMHGPSHPGSHQATR